MLLEHKEVFLFCQKKLHRADSWCSSSKAAEFAWVSEMGVVFWKQNLIVS